MTTISTSPHAVLFPSSEVNLLVNAISKKSVLTPEMATTLNQISSLEYAGFIPTKEATLLKNNLDSELKLEGILADLVVKLVNQGKLAPEMKGIIGKRKVQDIVLLLYTCHLEQMRCTFSPTIVQQQMIKNKPVELLKRMHESEEMESKEHVNKWLSSLHFSQEICQEALKPLLFPLEDAEFKKHFLHLLEVLKASEEHLPHSYSLNELHDLLKTKSGPGFFLIASQVLRASAFYQKHIHDIETGSYKDRKFSYCLIADMVKNAPHAAALPTYYNLLYGLVKKQWEQTDSRIAKPFVIFKGPSPDEEAISDTMQAIFNKTKRPTHTIEIAPLKENLKALTQLLLKIAPNFLLAAIGPRYQDFALRASKELRIPLAIFPPYTDTRKWEETSHEAFIAFPTPLNSDAPEEINLDKTKIAGIPGIFSNTKSKETLKREWGFSHDAKVIVIDTPEGDSPWPMHLAKEYRFPSNLSVIVITDPKNKDFIHSLKTKTSLQTALPIRIYTSLSSLEREEVLTMADVAIGKEREESSSLLFETSHAKTPLLLDNCPAPLFSGGFLGFLKRVPSLFSSTKKSPQIAMHEKLLNEENRGIMIQSPKNFKLSLEELLAQAEPLSAPKHLATTLSPLIKDIQQELNLQSEMKKPITNPHFFTTR